MEGMGDEPIAMLNVMIFEYSKVYSRQGECLFHIASKRLALFFMRPQKQGNFYSLSLGDSLFLILLCYVKMTI